MRNFAIVLFAALSATCSFAAEDLVLRCYPTEELPNGFNIKSLDLVISQEDPVATATIRRESGRSASIKKAEYDYEGSSTGYELIPTTKKDGPYRIGVKQVGPDLWKATVFDDIVDTFSALECPLSFEQIGARG